jgi:hypothetical protein
MLLKDSSSMNIFFFVMTKPQETYIKQARRQLPWNIFVFFLIDFTILFSFI